MRTTKNGKEEEENHLDKIYDVIRIELGSGGLITNALYRANLNKFKFLR